MVSIYHPSHECLYSSKHLSISQTSISKLHHILAGLLHIEDADLMTLNKGEKSINGIVKRSQHLEMLWHKASWVTGGDLKSKKSHGRYNHVHGEIVTTF